MRRGCTRAAGIAGVLTAVFAVAICQAASGLANPDCDIKSRALLDFAFPKAIHAVGASRALEYKKSGYSFRSLEEINKFNIRSQDFLPNSAHFLELKYAPMESPHWSEIPSQEGANKFIDDLAAVLAQSEAAKCSARSGDILEKALLQRDLYQLFSLLALAVENADEAHRVKGSASAPELANLLRSTLLSARDLAKLRKLRSNRSFEEFSPDLDFDLAKNYLPLAAVAEDPAWVTLQNRGTPFRHFTHYRGRSFVRVKVRSAALSAQAMEDMRRNIFDRFGTHLHATAMNDPVPSGMQTMLVRTFAVLMEDGSVRDSEWPEEVTLRAFKYPAATVDLRTSDFSGTVFFQYRLTREILSAAPRSLGLRRIHDDDEQFFGFLGDVPDIYMSYSKSTTTMRVNCIGCHAELFYGLNTIFSFERNPGFDLLADDNEIWTDVGGGQYRLKTAEFEMLSSYLWPTSGGRRVMR
jgi:hypothetical protein